MISSNNVAGLVGSAVIGSDGDKIGTVGQIYVDPSNGQPNWATVKTGLFGTSESFVPLEQATSEGDALHVPYDKALVKDAPRIETDAELDQAEEDALYRHYNLQGTSTVGDTDYLETEERSGVVGHDTSGPTTDDAMTRSEEQLHVGTEKVQTGRARLRKYVVTENQTVTVPVSREEVRLEREPITDANSDSALAGPAISEEEHEVILTEERPVVMKETVPVERVRLDKEVVTENEQVSEQVRKEQIEFVDDDKNNPRR